MFGPAFKDIRIKKGISLLSHIVGKRLLKKQGMEAVNKLLKGVLEERPELDPKGRLATHIPTDLFKTLHKILDISSFCNVNNFILKLVNLCQKTLEYFQNGMSVLIENAGLKDEQLVGICNDVMTFLHEVEQFVEQVHNMDIVDEKALENSFDEVTLSKTFVNLGKQSQNKLAENLFSALESPKSRNFMQIELRKLIDIPLNKMKEMIEKLHSNYENKLPAAMLKQAVNFYVKRFLDFVDNNNLKKESLKAAIAKLTEGQEILRDIFQEDLKEREIKQMISPIKEFEDFLNQDFQFLTLSVVALKNSLGNALKWSTILQLINLRDDEKYSKEEQDEMIISCQKVFQDPKNSQTEKEKFLEVNLTLDKALSSTSENGILIIEDTVLKKNGSSKSKILAMEGYLEPETRFLKELKNIIMGKHSQKFFSLHKRKMYCYKEKSSENALIKFNLKYAVNCREEDANKFVLRIKETNNTMKDYRFKGENEKERNQWVKAINNVMITLSNSDNDKIGIVGVKFFIDKTPLFTDKEAMPSLKYEFVKQKIERVMVVKDNNGLREHVDNLPKPSFCFVLCKIIGLINPKRYESPKRSMHHSVKTNSE